MARLTGIFTKLSGSVGQFTFKQLNGDTVVSEKVARKANPIRTWGQMRRRVAWDNIVAIYKAFTGHLHPSFEGKDRRLNDANMFMKSNINVVKVFLTKEEAAQGACVVAPYQITRGSMPSIEVTSSALAGYQVPEQMLRAIYSYGDVRKDEFLTHLLSVNL